MLLAHVCIALYSAWTFCCSAQITSIMPPPVSCQNKLFDWVGKHVKYGNLRLQGKPHFPAESRSLNIPQNQPICSQREVYTSKPTFTKAIMRLSLILPLSLSLIGSVSATCGAVKRVSCTTTGCSFKCDLADASCPPGQSVENLANSQGDGNLAGCPGNVPAYQKIFRRSWQCVSLLLFGLGGVLWGV